jgi:hypothetical protein
MSSTIGAEALYLLFLWLLSAAGAAWMADRKGYTERVGLTFGLILSVVGFLIVLLLPGRPGSVWKQDGPLPKRGHPQAAGVAEGPPAVIDTGAPPAVIEGEAPPAVSDPPGPPGPESPSAPA